MLIMWIVSYVITRSGSPGHSCYYYCYYYSTNNYCSSENNVFKLIHTLKAERCLNMLGLRCVLPCKQHSVDAQMCMLNGPCV